MIMRLCVIVFKDLQLLTAFLLTFHASTERTRITIGPKNRIVTEGTNVDLRCEATKDKSLELGYLWKKDNRVIKYDSKMQWLEGQHVLKISDIQVDDGGIYTCVAYTPDPKRSEDTASAIVNIKGMYS